MAGIKHSATIRDYTSFVSDLKSDLSRLQEDMKLQIYNHYPAFVEAYKELQTLQTVSTKPYEACLDEMQRVLDDLDRMEIEGEREVARGKREGGDWEERLDDLDALISEKRYEAACDLIESVAQQDSNDPKSRLLFDIQALRLVDTVAAQLADLQTTDSRPLIKVLTRLKAQSAAQEAFFLGKSKLLRVLLQRIDSKDPNTRALDLAKAFFTLVQSTSQEANALLGTSNGVLFWAAKETLYVGRAVGEVLSLFEDLNALLVCLRDMQALSELKGMSLSAQWSRALGPFVAESLSEHVGAIRAGIDARIRSELWKQQVVQMHVGSEVLVLRLSATAASLHKDSIQLLDICAQLLPHSPLLACDLLPKLLLLIQTLFHAFLSSKSLSGKKKMTQLVVLCCDYWNLGAVVREAQWKLETLFDADQGGLYDSGEIVSAAHGKFKSELVDFFAPLYAERTKAYLSALETEAEPRVERDIRESKCEEVLSVLRELHTTVSSSTDHDPTACSTLIDTISNIWSERLESLLFEANGYWSVNSEW
jgi:hypothetical protein